MPLKTTVSYIIYHRKKKEEKEEKLLILSVLDVRRLRLSWGGEDEGLRLSLRRFEWEEEEEEGEGNEGEEEEEDEGEEEGKVWCDEVRYDEVWYNNRR